MQSIRNIPNEDDKKKIDNRRYKIENEENKTKNNDNNEKNKMIKMKLMSKIKENKKKKQAADKMDKLNKNKNKNEKARKITEYMKPKSEPTKIPANKNENSVPGAARAGSLSYNLGSENDFSGENRKPENIEATSQPANRGLEAAALDWPDGTRGPRLSQSE